MSATRVPLSEPRFPFVAPANEQPQIVFTRQLWERTMPLSGTDESSTRSRSFSSIGIGRPTRLQSVDSGPPHPERLTIPPRVSDSPEESSPLRSSSRKRSADTFDQDDHLESSPSHTRDNSSESSVGFCLCQPEPKIPRPRNAFILYRQRRQAAIVAQNPGLANPEISKIIGKLWNSESDEEQNKWKAYAEEEKLQHSHRYPTYRYQPKRSGRRASVSSEVGPSESYRCSKCGGRSIAHPTPNTPSSGKEGADQSNGVDTSPTVTYELPTRDPSLKLPPPTPSSTTTPSTRYLPMLNNLSLASPQMKRMVQGRSAQPFVPMPRTDEHRSSPISPDSKRRRFESPQGTYVMATTPRQQQNGDPGPGTPFPFHPQQQQQQQMAHPMHVVHQQMNGGPAQYQHIPGRRESLPPAADILRGRPGSSGGQGNMMAPPPRPTPGYSQHRMSQGHNRPPGGELSLTLPPLQTVNVPLGPRTATRIPSGQGAVPEPKEADRRSLPEKIMSISYQHKIGILRRIMPPLPFDKQQGRGLIIAIEGDDAEAARNVTDWLEECLTREPDITVKVVDGPRPSNVAEYPELNVEDLFETIQQWRVKNKEIIELATHGSNARKDSVSETALSPDSAATPTNEQKADTSAMDIDDQGGKAETKSSKLVILFRTYTLTASNVYASGIPITDVYRADDHWQWTATLWRGIVGPDLTIYVKDSESSAAASATSATGGPRSSYDGGSSGAKGGVEIVEEAKMNYKFMAIRRMRGEDNKHEKAGGAGGCEGIEAGSLRRLGFEVGEWVRSAASSGGVDEQGRAA